MLTKIVWLAMLYTGGTLNVVEVATRQDCLRLAQVHSQPNPNGSTYGRARCVQIRRAAS